MTNAEDLRRRIAGAIAKLTDDADPLHNDMTPAVFALADIGAPAIPAILDVMLEDSRARRLVAQRALERIVMRRHGFVEGHGFTSAAAEQAFLDEWRTKGDYAYDADPEARRASVGKWRGTP